MQFKLYITQSVASTLFLGVMLTLPLLLVVLSGLTLMVMVLGECRVISQHLESFSRRNMIFILLVSSSSLQDPLVVIFMCLLTCLYTFPFLHQFGAPCCIQVPFMYTQHGELTLVCSQAHGTAHSVSSSGMRERIGKVKVGFPVPTLCPISLYPRPVLFYSSLCLFSKPLLFAVQYQVCISPYFIIMFITKVILPACTCLLLLSVQAYGSITLEYKKANDPQTAGQLEKLLSQLN